jgi:ubiquinone/menaquinone biosynthesis C-methylase UbiE
MSADRTWMSKHNARRYHEYAVRYPCFAVTSKKLVNFLNIRPPATVLDLACGTGQTATALLEAVPSGLDLILVDISPAMLSFARRALPRDNCTFVQGKGEELERLLQGRKVQYVICNRAIWHMDMSRVLRGVDKILVDGGKFAFNTFSGKFDLNPGKSPYDAVFQVADEPEYKNNHRPGLQSFAGSAVDDLGPLLACTTLKVSRRKREYLTVSSRQVFEFLRIPIMSEPILPDLGYEARHKIVCAAERYFGDDRIASVQAWELVLLKKGPKASRVTTAARLPRTRTRPGVSLRAAIF